MWHWRDSRGKNIFLKRAGIRIENRPNCCRKSQMSSTKVTFLIHEDDLIEWARFSTTGIEGGPNLSQFDLERLIWMYFSWLHSSAIVGVTVQDKRREIASLSSGSISNVQRALGNSFGKRSGKLRFSLECTPLLSRFRSRFQCRRNIEGPLEPVHFRHARK